MYSKKLKLSQGVVLLVFEKFQVSPLFHYSDFI